MDLEEIVPWGRNLKEYKSMFNLTNEDNILGVADGPSSFGKEMRALGKHVISADIVYAFKAKEIEERILEVAPMIEDQMEKSSDNFNFSGMFSSVKEVVKSRLETMKNFLVDYEKNPQFYKEATVLKLPFEDNSFDLALVSHFLFLYSEHLDSDFHCEAISEILRVSQSVRIFPLTDLKGEMSPHLEKILEYFSDYQIKVEPCSYEFVYRAHAYLEISRS